MKSCLLQTTGRAFLAVILMRSVSYFMSRVGFVTTNRCFSKMATFDLRFVYWPELSSSDSENQISWKFVYEIQKWSMQTQGRIGRHNFSICLPSSYLVQRTRKICHSSGSQSPDFHHGSTGSHLEQSMWDLW